MKPRVDVQVRLDFLLLGPVEERAVEASDRPGRAAAGPDIEINVPRETAVTVSDGETGRAAAPVPLAVKPASACLPLAYVADARQRIELYRKLAEVTSEEDVSRLKGELRDRFGALPPAAELLLQVAVLKVLAAERGVLVIESKEDKLMLLRGGDFIQMGGKFPRLTKREPRARLNEIRRLLQSLH